MPQHSDNSSAQWAHPLAYLITGFLIFETITGLAIYFLPFSLTNQIMVLVHTGIGLLFLIPFAWYQFKHWRTYRERQMSDVKLTGYISMFTVTAAILSGAVLTYQGLFDIRIGYVWKNIHIISTFILLGAMIPHILLIVIRDWMAPAKTTIIERKQAEKTFGVNSVYIIVVQFALVGLFMFAYSSPELDNSFPEGYEYPYGHDNPFEPSLAQTSTGTAIDARLLAGSESCGSSGCHEQIKEEWEVSAHRYAAEDPFFRTVQEAMGKEKGAASTRYCAGCHDPISLFAGTKNLYSEELTNKTGLAEGVSCVSCHSIKQVDERGNADYEIEPPDRYLYELHDGKLAKQISDFLIRVYPQNHIDSFQRSMFKSPEFCSSCHKQFIDEQITGVGWVQLQNQFDPWKESHWFSEKDPFVTIECRECHMPLVDSNDPASGDETDYNRTPGDEMHRSHRFLGANQFVPTILDLPNAKEQVKLIDEWLKGNFDIPEIADKWKEGAVVPLTLFTADSVEFGQELVIELMLENRKAGHDFPTGPLDIIQSWVEISAVDQNGRVIFSSGTLDDEYFIEPGSFIFRSEPVDQYGNPIDRHNLWDLVGVRYSRALFPGRSDYTRYAFNVGEISGNLPPEAAPSTTSEPANITGEITDINITAKLHYRKVNQYLMAAVFAEMLDVPTAPVTTLSEVSKQVKVYSNPSPNDE